MIVPLRGNIIIFIVIYIYRNFALTLLLSYTFIYNFPQMYIGVYLFHTHGYALN